MFISGPSKRNFDSGDEGVDIINQVYGFIVIHIWLINKSLCNMFKYLLSILWFDVELITWY